MQTTDINTQQYDFKFNGEATEYFKIWIINLCLTILTFGIYSAWAKVRTYRYFYGCTELDTHCFVYLADPVKILKGRIIAVFLLIVYSYIWNYVPAWRFITLAAALSLLPVIIVIGSAFTLQNSSYRNIKFYFKRSYALAYRLFLTPLGIALISAWVIYMLVESSDFVSRMEHIKNSEFHREDLVFTLFIMVVIPLIPYIDYIRTRFLINQSQFGNLEFSFHARTWDFYKIYLAGFVFLLGASFFIGFSSGFVFALLASLKSKNITGISIAVITIIFYIFIFYISAFIRAQRINLICKNTRFGENTFTARLRTGDIGWLYISNAVGVVLSLGLLIPWAIIRMKRYTTESVSFIGANLSDITEVNQQQSIALGEELIDVFNIDIGF